jgi:5-hydroxyisourate hydrolase-like protein (transthyretin family)
MTSNKRITRSATPAPGVTVEVERESMGQVTEYEVYVTNAKGRVRWGGGTKREAQRIFDRTVKRFAKGVAK